MVRIRLWPAVDWRPRASAVGDDGSVFGPLRLDNDRHIRLLAAAIGLGWAFLGAGVGYWTNAPFLQVFAMAGIPGAVAGGLIHGPAAVRAPSAWRPSIVIAGIAYLAGLVTYAVMTAAVLGGSFGNPLELAVGALRLAGFYGVLLAPMLLPFAIVMAAAGVATLRSVVRDEPAGRTVAALVIAGGALVGGGAWLHASLLRP
jgi:hypothetical protein